MSMVKLIPPRAWADFDHLAQVEMVKVSEHRLRGTDLANFVKRASHPLALWVRDNPPKPGETYVHSHIFGVTDTTGPNRNADAYSRKMAREDLASYEKVGRAYRNHANRVPAEAMGVVKKAYLNEDMGRAEVIVALNETKEAAERNGGVTADRTLEKLANGEDLAVSQSCRVPYDECSSCGHRAKNRGEYCTAMTCKYGGCRDNLGRVFDDGHHLHVDNPKCTFFDWSDVSDTRGADRTAFITGKVAAADRVIGGAELAEMMNLVPPEHLLDPTIRSATVVLKKLAASRTTGIAPDWSTIVHVRAKIAAVSADEPTFTGSDAERHTQVCDLGRAGVVLPPDIWLSAITGSPREKCAAVYLTGFNVETDLVNRQDLHDLLSAYAFEPVKFATNKPNPYWLAPTAKAHGRETQLALLGATKTASNDPVPPTVVKEAKARYLAYQVGVLLANQDSVNFDLLLTDCLRHNGT